MAKRPNFLIFMTDHQQGATLLEESPCLTPNVDALRRRGVTFTNAYCPAPHCCPARATFFTGLYPAQHGVWNNVNVGNTLSRGLFENVRTFSEDLSENGYRLYFSGKWHVSEIESPAERGFELLRCTESYRQSCNLPSYREWQMYNNRPIDNENTPRHEADIVRPGYPHYKQYAQHESPFGDRETADAAIEKLNSLTDSNEPFLMYVGPIGPHDPYLVPQRFLDMYPEGSIKLPATFDDDMQDKPVLYRRTRSRYEQLTRKEHEESLRHYYAFCSYEDYLFGQVMDALERSGKADNTVVLYLSDHGDYAGAHGLWAKGLPSFKQAYDICAVVGGAGITAPDRCENAFVSLADFAPTILELAGVRAEREMTGRSLVSFLHNTSPADWRDTCFTQSNGNEVYGIQRIVWNRKWKYVFNTFDFDELYDLENDQDEMHNLIYSAHPENGPYRRVIRDMCLEMWRFAHKTHDNCVNPYIMTAMAPFGPGILLEEMDKL